MKRTRIKNESAKKRARREEAKPWRDQRVIDYPSCWICGTEDRDGKRIWPIREQNQICVHEIASHAGMRLKFLDKPCATLVLCWRCNLVVEDRSEWPEERQLNLLREKAPSDFDLRLYLELTNPRAPRRIEIEEIDFWDGPEWIIPE